jgi:hypothetical protein
MIFVHLSLSLSIENKQSIIIIIIFSHLDYEFFEFLIISLKCDA